jgi:GNAT superfamily N-acetyltransferase
VDGAIVAAVLTEGAGTAYLQVPSGQASYLPALIEWSEKHLRRADTGDIRRLGIFAADTDTELINLLLALDYRPSEIGEVQRRLELATWNDQEDVPRSYSLRKTEAADAAQISQLLNASFGRSIHNAEEYLNFRSKAPSFRKELDIVAVASDGSLAAYVGVCVDDHLTRAIVEPVCTHPNHRGHGLARATLIHALLRAKRLRLHDAIVSTGNTNEANSLYEQLGFGAATRSRAWSKSWRDAQSRQSTSA